jgi:hypothetical protein
LDLKGWDYTENYLKENLHYTKAYTFCCHKYPDHNVNNPNVYHEEIKVYVKSEEVELKK